MCRVCWLGWPGTLVTNRLAMDVVSVIEMGMALQQQASGVVWWAFCMFMD